MLHACGIKFTNALRLKVAQTLPFVMIILTHAAMLRQQDNLQQKPDLAVRASAQVRMPALDLIPHRLHLREAVDLVPMLGKLGRHRLGLLYPSSPKQRLGCHAVQVSASPASTTAAVLDVQSHTQVPCADYYNNSTSINSHWMAGRQWSDFRVYDR